MENHPRYRSLFWPILLVGVGAVWLLSNLGYIEPVSLGSVLRLWPLLLIVLGLDLLFSRRFPWVGAVVGLLAVGAVIAFLAFGSRLGLSTNTSTRTDVFKEPAGETTSVEYIIEASAEPVELSVLADTSTDLVVANITHRGTMNFGVTGTTDKTIRLSEIYDDSSWMNWDLSFDTLKWDIALAPNMPTDLVLDGGSGSLDVDLTGLLLNSFRSDFGSGSASITLPVTEDAYSAEIESGSGSVTIDLPSDTDMTLTLDSGSGSISVDVPSDVALRVEVMDDGSGSLSLPNDLVKSADATSFSIGSWQSDDYANAAAKILIKILGQGSGSISIN
jgi:hypothetical protein